MKQTEIIEGNKLIAEFMGIDFITKNSRYRVTGNDFTEPHNSRFHSSWDWLMPVVEKITNILKEKQHVPIGSLEYDKYDQQWKRLFNYQSYNFFQADIIPIYNAMLDFIKWYNSQKQ